MPRRNGISCYQTDIFDGDDLDFEDFLAAGTFSFTDYANLTHSKQIREQIGQTSTTKPLAHLKTYRMQQLRVKAI